MKERRTNEEINQELSELENRRMVLVMEKMETEKQIITLGVGIAQLRRQFKIEGYSTRKFRLSDDAKKVIIEERGGKCTKCSSTDDLSVHHVIPLSHGGTNEAKNLEVLCLNCHRKHHKI